MEAIGVKALKKEKTYSTLENVTAACPSFEQLWHLGRIYRPRFKNNTSLKA